jgi:adenylosuccinate synthase
VSEGRAAGSAVFIVVGLGYGDEGKGSIVDWLVRRRGAKLVVRFNGGPQAAHHVVSPEGVTHCFSQFGAGTLVPGVGTHLSRFVAVDPLALEREEAALIAAGVDDAFERWSVDPRCVVVTPFHAACNRVQEIARGGARHGSCGLGVGQALLDAERPGLPILRVGDILDEERARRTLRLLRLTKLDLAEQLAAGIPSSPALERELLRLRDDSTEALAAAYAAVVQRAGARVAELSNFASGTFVFEGAQGVLLDRSHGFFPFVTPSRTTFEQALSVLSESGFEGSIGRLGVLRAYSTRHGAGPFVTEDPELTAARPDRHNLAHDYQGGFRVGWFDAVAARYAIRACGGVDGVAITNVDRLAGLGPVKVCTAYELDARIEERLLGRVVAERVGDRTVIHDILPIEDAPIDEREALTALINACRPRYVTLAGWTSSDDAAARSFLGFLASPDALGAPVTIASFGPSALDKIELDAATTA